MRTTTEVRIVQGPAKRVDGTLVVPAGSWGVIKSPSRRCPLMETATILATVASEQEAERIAREFWEGEL